MSGDAMREIMRNITSNYVNVKERNAASIYYDDENDKYGQGDFYLDQSLKFNPKQLSQDGKTIEKYGEMTWTFIEK
jgi:hypothetical protein